MPSLKRKRAGSQEVGESVSTFASALSASELSSLPVPLTPLTTRLLAPDVDSPGSSSMSSVPSARANGKKRKRIKEEDVHDVEMDVEFANGSTSRAEPANMKNEVDVEGRKENPLKVEEDEHEHEHVLLATTANGTSSKRKGKQRADPYFVDDEEDEDFIVAGPSNHNRYHAGPSNQSQATPNLLSSYTCPVCFSTVTNACLTPCGHILCGACLFASVRSGIQRSMELAVVPGQEGSAKCPVCRAVIKNWDGNGRGITPLRLRTIMAL